MCSIKRGLSTMNVLLLLLFWGGQLFLFPYRGTYVRLRFTVKDRLQSFMSYSIKHP